MRLSVLRWMYRMRLLKPTHLARPLSLVVPCSKEHCRRVLARAPLKGMGGGGGAPLCDIPSGCCSFTGPWLVTRSSLRMLRRVAAFCRPLRPVLLLVPFPRSRSPVVGVLGLC